MPTMKGGQAVVNALGREGVEVVFGIPGVHTLEIYDALYDRSQIRTLVARHEQGAALMADGYARASGRVGVALVITGPGVTNAATAIGQAYADGSPLLVISSEVDSRHSGKGNLHELKDQLGMTRAITKWSARAESVAEIPAIIHEAHVRAMTEWPGPVHVEIPIDVLGAEGDADLPPVCLPTGRAASDHNLEQAASFLRDSQRPFIFAGWGVTAADANAELQALAERLGAPVLTSPTGKGAIPDDHPLSLGAAWRPESAIAELMEGADLVLAVGTRLGGMETRGWSLPMPKLIHIDPDPANIGKGYSTELGVVGDPKTVLGQLVDALQAHSGVDRSAKVAKARDEIVAHLHERSPEMDRLLRDIRQQLDRDAIVSVDMTIPTYWAATYMPVYEPRTFIDPYNFMSLGCGLPLGIGAKIARPDRQVVVLCGDGGFMFTVQEMATAVKYGLDMTIVLFNNDCYGAIRRNQQRRFDGRVIDADLVNPDFVKLAEAFGIPAVRLPSTAELGTALQGALQAKELRLIEVPIHALAPPW